MAEAMQSPQRSLWSILALSEQFDMPWNTVKRKLKKVPPDGKLNGNSAWYMTTAAPHLVKPAQAVADDADALEKLSPKELRDWAAGQRDLLKLELERNQVCDAGDVARQFAVAFGKVAQTFDVIPDILERDAGIGAAALPVVERLLDRMREDLYQQLLRDGPPEAQER